LEILELCVKNDELECVGDTVDVLDEDTDLEVVVVTVLVLDELAEPVKETDEDDDLDSTEEAVLEGEFVFILENVTVALVVVVFNIVFEGVVVIEFTIDCFAIDEIDVVADIVLEVVIVLVGVEVVDGELVICIELVSELLIRIDNVSFGVCVVETEVVDVLEDVPEFVGVAVLCTVFDTIAVDVVVFVRILLGLTVVVSVFVLLLLIERDILLEPEDVFVDIDVLVGVGVLIGVFVTLVLREKDGEELDVLDEEDDFELLLEPVLVFDGRAVNDTQGEPLDVLLIELEDVVVLDKIDDFVFIPLDNSEYDNKLDIEERDDEEPVLETDDVFVEVSEAVLVFDDVDDGVIGFVGNDVFDCVIVLEDVLL